MATGYSLDCSTAVLHASSENGGEEDYHDGPCLILKDCVLEPPLHPGRGLIINKPASVIPLNKDVMTIGRSLDVDICILSNSVSRRHATLFRQPSNGHWCIIDNESINGVYVNGERLLNPSNKQRNLSNGDVIHFAPPNAPGVSYIFQLHSMLKRSTSKTETWPKKCCLGSETISEVKRQDTPMEKDLPMLTPATSIPKSEPLSEDFEISPEKRALLETNKALQAELSEMKRNFEECVKRKEAELKEQIESHQATLAREKEQLEKKLKESEAMLQEETQAKLTKLLSEQKTAAEEKKMMQNLLDRLKEKDNNEEKRHLEQKLFQAELQCISLQRQLEEIKTSSSSSETSAAILRENLLKNFSQTLETELQCSICNELFVKAMTLTCSHSFCQFCINEWRKKKNECPMCRQVITFIAPSVVLDNYIDKVVETFTTELKDRRQSLLKERQEMSTKAPTANTPNKRQRGARGRATTTRWGTRILGEPVAAATVQTILNFPHDAHVVVEPIEISSESSTSDESGPGHYSSSSMDDDDDDVIVEGTGAYYGGYGACYRCGRRGHWANGCPF